MSSSSSSSSLLRMGTQAKNGWVPYDIGIMLIDEEPSCLFYLHTLLKTCHYRVVSFQNPEEALHALYKRNNEFDLVITDLHTITMPGFRVVESINQGVKLPVITTCADEDPMLLYQALDCGACFHLVKPLTIKNMEYVWKKSWRTKARRPIEPTPRLMNFEGFKMPMDAFKTGGAFHVEHMEQIGISSNLKVTDYIANSSRKKKDEQGDIRKQEQWRPRLQWDYDLQERFRVAVSLLEDDAIPSSIIGIMNVAGPSTKQIASHLQKYRKHVNKQKRNISKVIKEKPAHCSAQKSPTTSASNKRPIQELINNQNEESKDEAMMSNSGKSIFKKIPCILPELLVAPQVSTFDNVKYGRSKPSQIQWQQREIVANFKKSQVFFPMEFITNQVSIQTNPAQNATGGTASLLQNQKRQAEFGVINNIQEHQNQVEFDAIREIPQQIPLNTHSGCTMMANPDSSSAFPICSNTHMSIDPLMTFQISNEDNNLISLGNYNNPNASLCHHSFPCIMNSTTETTMLLPHVNLSTISNLTEEPIFGDVKELSGLDEFICLDEPRVAEKDKVVEATTLDCDISVKGITFDDALLAEMMDHIDKGDDV